ncbi:MAG: glycoside hydrolase family 31 protein [Muribaculaceae bacterium]|nr:glycoside hydrolase family 31 protein [Muribaculaceae bacterium]
MRKIFSLIFFLTSFAGLCEEVLSGVWKFTIGVPDSITPVKTRSFPVASELSEAGLTDMKCPVEPAMKITSRGVEVSIPLKAGEAVYGLGEQFGSMNHRGTKKSLRVNADPTLDTGDSHAPVPFYVTSEGYGVLIDNARNITFYCGNKDKVNSAQEDDVEQPASNDAWNAVMSQYQRTGMHKDSEMIIDIPNAKGVDIYIFDGPTAKEAIARYNMFSGGGCVPPRWALGFWYRGHSDFTDSEYYALIDTLQSNRIPCDVIGLEPHWQSHSYSSSYIWDPAKFPDYKQFISSLGEKGYHLNMWLHAFVHPTAPAYKELKKWSGDYSVWEGLVPDFILPEGRQIFASQMEPYVAAGLSGFKADECDNSDFTGNWSFPYIAQFPSGADGEQMHNLYGIKFQQALLDLFKNQDNRTFNLVRSSGALAAPEPFVLYSDLYDHKTYIKGIAQAGFSGLLWCPELRHTKSSSELMARLKTAVFSPLCMFNGWYLKDAPWTAYMNDDKDIKDNFRKLIETRMTLIPYIHSAFVNYQNTGIPPFRALILDYPEEAEELRFLDSQYMIGENIMAAPQHNHSDKIAKIYFPKGRWYDFFTNEVIDSNGEYKNIELADAACPVYVKDNTILPLANITLNTENPASRKLTFKIYGNPLLTSECILYDDPQEFQPSFKPQRFFYDKKKKKVVGEKGFYSLSDTELIK